MSAALIVLTIVAWAATGAYAGYQFEVYLAREFPRLPVTTGAIYFGMVFGPICYLGNALHGVYGSPRPISWVARQVERGAGR